MLSRERRVEQTGKLDKHSRFVEIEDPLVGVAGLVVEGVHLVVPRDGEALPGREIAAQNPADLLRGL